MSDNIVKLEDMGGVYSSPDRETLFNQISLAEQLRILRGDGGYCKNGLLGDAEYIKLLADLIDGEPQTTKYINLVGGINYTNSSSDLVIFQGIKEMLKGFVYFAYMNSLQYSATEFGQRTDKTQNAEIAKNFENTNGLRFNMAVDIYNKEAYSYIEFNKSLFPDWKFSAKGKKFTNGLSY